MKQTTDLKVCNNWAFSIIIKAALKEWKRCLNRQINEDNNKHPVQNQGKHQITGRPTLKSDKASSDLYYDIAAVRWSFGWTESHMDDAFWVRNHVKGKVIKYPHLILLKSKCRFTNFNGRVQVKIQKIQGNNIFFLLHQFYYVVSTSPHKNSQR